MNASTQHPMWLVTIYTEGGFHVIPSRVGFSGPDLSTDDFRYWLRAPTASAALARAEALRAGVPEPVAAPQSLPTLERRVAELENRLATVIHGLRMAASHATEFRELADFIDMEMAKLMDVPLRQPAEITGAVEPPKEAP